jgi:hypothetical protein
MDLLKINWIIIILSGLVPLFIGFVWYGKLFGVLWRKESGMTLDDAKSVSMVKAIGFTILFGIMAALAIMPMVLHQMHYLSVFAGYEDTKLMKDESSSLFLAAKQFMADNGQKFRTFKHGAFHGFLGSFFLALPLIGMSAVYERKSWRYILIHFAYWAVCMMIIGGIISQWA